MPYSNFSASFLPIRRPPTDGDAGPRSPAIRNASSRAHLHVPMLRRSQRYSASVATAAKAETKIVAPIHALPAVANRPIPATETIGTRPRSLKLISSVARTISFSWA